MAAYQYEAVDSSGKKSKGVINGDSARQAREQLRSDGLFPTRIQEVSGRDADNAIGTGSGTGRISLKPTELSVFTRQFSTLVNSGLTVETALHAIADEHDSSRTKALISAVRSSVREGRSLADSMANFPRTFNELYISSIDAGERSGKLNSVLDNVADYLENRVSLQRRLGTQLVYPMVLLVVALLVVFALLTFVVPNIVGIVTETGGDLPLATRLLLSVSAFFQQFWWLMLAGGVCLVLFLRAYFKRPQPRQWLHGKLLRVPLFGAMILRSDTSRLARTLAILSGSGVPLITALKSSAGVMSNVVLRASVNNAAVEVGQGYSLHRALQRSGHFPTFLIQMVANGEQTGRLAEMLEKTAGVVENEHEANVKVFVSLFEPMVVVFMAGIILFIVMAVLLPIMNLNQLIQ
ncbi:type II secretion system inner membrane protein GspF [Gammaproteobacteria bacterium]|nr:type II secretion system inner membrane protein GspF [Gammaproteobacteria bacterium]